MWTRWSLVEFRRRQRKPRVAGCVSFTSLLTNKRLVWTRAAQRGLGCVSYHKYVMVCLLGLQCILLTESPALEAYGPRAGLSVSKMHYSPHKHTITYTFSMYMWRTRAWRLPSDSRGRCYAAGMKIEYERVWRVDQVNQKKTSGRDFLVRAGPGISNFFWSRLMINIYFFRKSRLK